MLWSLEVLPSLLTPSVCLCPRCIKNVHLLIVKATSGLKACWQLGSIVVALP
jgi:hypothetical protein